MVSRSPRPNSNGSTVTAGSGAMRPTSRQSTASTQSNVTQPSHPPPQNIEGPYPMPTQMPSAIWQQHQDPMGQTAMGPQQVSNHAFMGDSTMQHHTSMSFSNDSFQNAPAMSIEMSGQYDSLNAGDSQFDFSMDNGMQEENTTEGTKKKKGSASSQANDVELRRLFSENRHKSLKDVATQVMKDEKGPKSEKTKQIFGMIWLATHAKKSNSSVPRNRVFSSYATRCGTERVPPLNPASFGKLVRIIFPGITTRRLGVRGESKYHYVELSLIDDNRPERASVPRARSMTVDSTGRESVKPSLVARPSFGGDNAYFSPIDSPRPTSAQAKPSSNNNNNGSLYLQNPGVQDFDFRANEADMMQRPLQFQKSTAPPVPGDVQLDLPSIEPYLPQGVDVDAVDSLTSVYRSHCLLAIDNFRFCKTEKLSDSYKSLIGLLTVPGQKLLAHPQIAAWIRACDWMKYQKMIPMLDMIILTQVPKKAMAHMEHVAMNICPWISQYFQNQPRHTQDAMLEPANLFVALLERFLRVNRAALDVADVMESPELRTALWNDWIQHLKPFHVLQNSLMWNGHKRTFHILTQEARFLLSPIQENIELTGSHIFEDNGSRSEFQLIEMQSENDGSSSAIIARLARFLASLVHRFPGVDARDLLSHIEVTGNNISRNLTLNGAASLGNWWRIKLFIDEMSYWLAEKGGFLDTNPEAATQRQVSWQLDGTNFAFTDEPMNHDVNERMPLQDKTNREKNQQLGAGNTSGFSQGSRGTTQGSKESTGKPAPNSKKHADQEELSLPNDDSGIGMGLEDEFNMDSKYNTFVEGVHGSDPADVVVC